MVKERPRLTSNAKHTDRDRGENRYLAVPRSKKTGTKTMQMQRVDKKSARPPHGRRP